MNPASHERIVVSVGGSLIVPDRIDADFLARLKAFVLEQVARGFSFVIIAGGGATARRYQEAANAVTPLSAEDTDWLGIHATRLNAQLLRNVFAGHAHPHIVKNPGADLPADQPVLIAAGWRPGHSTDYDAVLIAKNLGARRLVNLTDTDCVYTADPKKNPSARSIERIGWSEFRRLIPPEWDPGLSSPFDPVAAKEAQALGLEVAVMNGAKLDEFAKYLGGRPFTGTVIA